MKYKAYRKTNEKHCVDCKEILPLFSFGVRLFKTKKELKQIPASLCKRCVTKRTLAWKLKNGEKWRLYHRNYQREKLKDPAFREERRIYSKNYWKKRHNNGDGLTGF